MEHMQFETDLCVQLGPIPVPACFPCVYDPWDISTMLTPAVENVRTLSPEPGAAAQCVSPTSTTSGGHYSDLDTPPPPNEDDHSEDRLASMTVAPPVHYLSFLHTRFFLI